MKIDLRTIFSGNGGFYTVLFATLLLQFLTFSFGVDGGVRSTIFKVISSVADASLLLFLCVMLRGRWKYAILALPFAVSLVLEVNVLFFRNFGDIIPGSSYFHSSLSDPTVVDGAMASLKGPDILFAVLPFIPLAYTVLTGRRRLADNDGRKHWLVASGLVAFLSWTAAYVGAYRRVGIFLDKEEPGKIAAELFTKDARDWKFYYDEHNFAGYLLRVVFSQGGGNHRLTDEEKSYVRNYLAEKNSNDGASALNGEEQKNLIVLVVESFPWVAMPTDSTAFIAPVIHGLAADSSVTVQKVRVDIGIGQSSDAQFIFNTGLLPLRSEPLVTNHSFNDYPSLPKALGYSSLEVIGEKGSLWSHGATNRSYGYDRLVDDVATNVADQDSVILQRALREIEETPSPFFAFITTLSMHATYTSPNVSNRPDLSKTGLTDPRDLEFLRRLNHFDASLGRFIEGLKAAGLYENTVIVVIGDHSITEQNISPAFHDDSVPMIILNSPLKPAEDVEVAGQIDLFPSVLDMMGRTYIYKGVGYSGLGRSIFSADGRRGVPTDEDYRVSELLIRSDLSEF